MADEQLASRSLLFVGVETTGRDPALNEIVELSAVRVHPQLLFIQREMTTRVRPQFPERCSIETAALNGFDPEKWDDAPDIYDALKRFTPIAEGCVLAGHNVGFDRAFLDSGLSSGRAHVAEDGLPRHRHRVARVASRRRRLPRVSLALRRLRRGRHRHRRRALHSTHRRPGHGGLPPPHGGAPRVRASGGAAVRRRRGRDPLRSGRPPRRGKAHLRNVARRRRAKQPGEALLEVLDALNYCAAELVRLSRAKGEVV